MASLLTKQRLGPILLVFVLSLLAQAAGLFSSWNQQIADTRKKLSHIQSDGQFIFVAIDPQSLRDIGAWPWSRSVHAEILDALIAAGAIDVLFDFDFAFPRDAEGDQAFARALDAAGGATYLAVFQQNDSATGPGTAHYNLPLPLFADRSWPALVNVESDLQGLVRAYPFGAVLENEFIPSAGALLAGRLIARTDSFDINFAIRADTIPVVSALDLLNGDVPRDTFFGRSAIVGASAIELSDQLTVPVQGIVPGPLLHALAAETLTRNLSVIWMRAEWVGLALAVMLTILRLRETAPPIVFIGLTVLMGTSVELAALWAFRAYAIMVPTALLYPGLVVYAFMTLARSLHLSNWLLAQRSAEARNSLKLLERVFDDSTDGIVILSSEKSVLKFSASAGAILGISETGALILPERLRRAEPLPQHAPPRIYEATDESGTKLLEFRVTSSNLERPVGLGKQILSDRITTLVLRDITQIKTQERNIAYLSNYDGRTGALRRHVFLAFLEMRLERGMDTIIFAITLDRFKTVNVTLGREVGDAILREIVLRIENSPLQLSPPMRLGGTSFSFFTEGKVLAAEAEGIAQDILKELSRVYRLQSVNAQVGVRVGHSHVTGQEQLTPEVALDQAVEAMDAAKSSGAAIVQYDQSAWEHQKRAREIERAMEGALMRGEFQMLYQPQHRVLDGAFIGAEALIRWNSPTLGKVFPDEFIGIAEATGFIVELGNWTLERSAKDALKLPPDTVIAVNVSGIQIMRGNLVVDTARILKEVGLATTRICFELTETVMLDANAAVIETMQDLQFLGISWALDDFGTGFSSMEYLSRMPLDKVKLDKSFVMKLGDDPAALPILRSTSELCRGLSVKLLCEGVETAEQRAVLIEEKCAEAQGYYFAAPLTIDALLDHAAERRFG